MTISSPTRHPLVGSTSPSRATSCETAPPPSRPNDGSSMLAGPRAEQPELDEFSIRSPLTLLSEQSSRCPQVATGRHGHRPVPKCPRAAGERWRIRAWAATHGSSSGPLRGSKCRPPARLVVGELGRSASRRPRVACHALVGGDVAGEGTRRVGLNVGGAPSGIAERRRQLGSAMASATCNAGCRAAPPRPPLDRAGGDDGQQALAPPDVTAARMSRTLSSSPAAMARTRPATWA